MEIKENKPDKLDEKNTEISDFQTEDYDSSPKESRLKEIVLRVIPDGNLKIDANKHPELFAKNFEQDIFMSFDMALNKAFPNGRSYTEEEYNFLKEETKRQIIRIYDDKLPGFADEYAKVYIFFDTQLDNIKNAEKEIEEDSAKDNELVEKKRLLHYEAVSEGNPKELTSEEIRALHDEIHELYNKMEVNKVDICKKYGIDISNESLWKQRVRLVNERNNAASKAVNELNTLKVSKNKKEETEPIVEAEPIIEKDQFKKVGDMEEEEVIKQYFSYNDTLNRPEEEITIYPYQKKYVESFKEITRKENFVSTVDKIRDEYENVMQKLSLDSSIFGMSQSWIYWDLAKQDYFFNNQQEADSKYDIGNPSVEENIQNQIVNRHIGWEIFGNFKEDTSIVDRLNKSDDSFNRIVELLDKTPKENQTLSSYDLGELGKYIRKNLVSFDR